jgi:hypothetical protein
LKEEAVARVDHLEAERERDKAYAEARTIVEVRAAAEAATVGLAK